MTMTIGSFGSALPLMLLLLVSLLSQIVPLRSEDYCNVQKFGPTDPFFTTLNNLLDNMEQHTPASGVGYKWQVAGSGGSPTAYGESFCQHGISASDCTNCLTSVVMEIWIICGLAIGAQGQYTQCSMRYEQYQF